MSEPDKKETTSVFNKNVSRRDVLKAAGIGGVGVLIGASGIGGALALADVLPTSQKKENTNAVVPFYGKHQAGIATEVQNHIYFAAFDVTAEDRNELIQLFKEWTKAAAAMTEGKSVGDPANNKYLPPDDTGEAAGLNASNLTITFGVGPTLFTKNNKDRFGLQKKQPDELKELPKFPLDSLEEQWTGGDLCIQACSDDLQVAFHAVRNLARIARGKAVLRWAQAGFQRTKQASPKKETPRNLFGFKDGTVNPNVKNSAEMNQYVWVQPGDGPDWLVNGTYLVVRRIQMFIEVWDRTTLKEQENTFGRYRDSGAYLGQKNEFDPPDFEKKDENGEYYIPMTSHVRVAHGDGKQKILRRSYSYADGIDAKTGTFDAGLLFISFQRSISKQFIPIQKRLSQMDELNEYIVHRGSAVFACLPGVKKGGYIGETLFS
ncbi:iron uptake transporter deferrochelatase/peroxidase subunit [Aeribacillus pallidus]|uniref:Deferrochelatase n=1 Tax=Aeribacillus pallidus TaxID=33936 RepID=A0A223E2B4_9BACI|nr:iron uptake transporter deferrochelatase/peroxidase subunit [Aeribacillus pallidus]ASS89295.1 deferrochelatase [Aeribacillus pallidus]